MRLPRYARNDENVYTTEVPYARNDENVYATEVPYARNDENVYTSEVPWIVAQARSSLIKVISDGTPSRCGGPQ